MDWLLSPWTIGATGAAVIAIAIAIKFYLPVIGSFFVSTKIGRYIAAAAGVIFAVWFAAMKLYQAGKSNVKDSIRRDSLEKDQRKEQRDAELKKLDDDALRKRASRWVRD